MLTFIFSMFNYFIILTTLIVVGISQKNEGDDCVFSYTNSLGHCKKVEECESARRQSSLNGWIQPTFCTDYDEFGNALICCTDGSNILQAAALRSNDEQVVLETAEDSNKRISEIKCEEYSKSVTAVVSYLPLQNEEDNWRFTTSKCKYTGIDLIIGGSDADLGEFPHMAAIGFANFENYYSFLCGGTLISPKFVITAGHCTRSTKSRTPEPVIVRLGDHNLDTSVEDGAKPIDVPIRKIHMNPSYKSPIVYHDLALLELAASVPFSSGIRPACLWDRDGVGGYTKAIATGWGITDTRRDSEPSKILKKVVLNLFENDFCSSLLDANRNWDGFIDSQMCAGDLGGGNDTCQGDSGGPLQVTSNENKCIFYILGVTSVGRKCAEANMPAVYTRVSSYIDWIESVVWPK